MKKGLLIFFTSLLFAFGCSTENLTPEMPIIYGYKIYSEYSGHTTSLIVQINPINGSETTIAELPINKNVRDKYRNLVYASSTNEIIGIYDDNALLKVNVKTGVSTFVPLAGNGRYNDLVLDEKQNLYAYTNSINLIKIDKVTGAETTIANLPQEYNTAYNFFRNIAYDPSSNEIIGISGNSLLKVNLETGKSTIVTPKNNGQNAGLVLNKNQTLYTTKIVYNNLNRSGNLIVKIDKTTGSESIIADLMDDYDDMYSYTYVYQNYSSLTNEIIGIYNNNLLRLNVETGKSIMVRLENKVAYDGLLIAN
jgi:hypothetical protein